jgi:capsular polysaccharide biosynthesis protein
LVTATETAAPPTEGQRKVPPGARRRRGRRKLLAFLLIVAPVAVAVCVYAISSTLAPRYEASSTLRIVAQGANGLSDQLVTASNDLASQYAQLADAPPVIHRAARALHIPASELDGEVSGGTVAAQNLISIAARADNSTAAVRRSQAVAVAFIDYASSLNERQASVYSRSVQDRLKPLDSEIAAARKLLNRGDPSQRNSTALVYSNLLVQRQQLVTSLAQSAAASQPGVQLVAPAASASKVQPKPVLYALVALVAAALVAARIGYLAFRRGRTANA